MKKQFDKHFTQWERIGDEVRPVNPFDKYTFPDNYVSRVGQDFETFAKSHTYPLIGYTGDKTVFEKEELKEGWQCSYGNGFVDKVYYKRPTQAFDDIRPVMVYTPIEQEVKEKGEEKEPLSAKLRNLLSPAYGLGAMVSTLPNTKEARQILKAQAMLCHANKDKIDSLLTEIDNLCSPQPSQEEKTEHNQWISVKDRLPEVQQFVLAYLPEYGNPNIQTLWRADWANGEQWFNVYWKTYRLEEVTHWMPLPEPPKD